MKHLIATLICVCAITVYTLFSCWYIGNFSKDISGSVQYCKKENYSAESVDKLKKAFESKEKILMLMVNKEHIDEVEGCIAEIEAAAEYDNMQVVKSNTTTLINTIEDIKKASHTLF